MVLPILILTVWFGYGYFLAKRVSEKVYVAVGGEGKVAVLNPATGKIIAMIDLIIEHNGGIMPYFPSSLQVNPDMKTVWVAANAGTHQNHVSAMMSRALAHGEEGSDGATDSDDVIVIDTESDKIIKRIPIGIGARLTRITLEPDGFSALVTAEARGAVYKINTKTFVVEDRLPMPVPEADEKKGKYKTAKSPDGARIYTADTLNGEVLIISAATNEKINSIKVGKEPNAVGVWVKK